jgi:hypothetical protein
VGLTAEGPGRGRRRQLPAPWTGITGPHCEECSWSWRDGVREVKVRSTGCAVHGDAAMAAAAEEAADGDAQ